MIGHSQAMVTTELSSTSPPMAPGTATLKVYLIATEAARGKYLAAAFIGGADILHFGAMLETLENDYLRGDKTCYPIDVNEAYNLLSNWKSDPKNISRILENTS